MQACFCFLGLQPAPAGNRLWTAEKTRRRIFRQIRVLTAEGGTILFELNDSSASGDLYAQLPLTVQIEDFSTNEKIFYPPQELNTENSPLAEDGAGTLAYYAPWGDVVMFYGDYNENSSLYELGQAVSGGERKVPFLTQLKIVLTDKYMIVMFAYFLIYTIGSTLKNLALV